MDIVPVALYILAQVSAFLLGGIPFGYLTARFVAGIDIRDHGSGNIGATNVGRVLGGKYFVLVFLLDFLKGALPVAAALYLRRVYSESSDTAATVLMFLPECVGFAAILGHIFPVYLGLRGGKGVATALGVVVLLLPFPALCALGSWILLVLTSRMVSAGSVAAAITLAAVHFFGTDGPWSRRNLGLTLFVIVVVVLVVVRHWANVKRMAAGSEPRIRLPWQRSPEPAPDAGNEPPKHP